MSSLPFTSSVGWGSINVEGWTPQPGQELQVDQRGATPDYFRTMEIPLRAGAVLHRRATCRPDGARRSVHHRREVRAALLAERGTPIGKHLWGDPKCPMTIVGVVGTVKQYGLDVDGRIVVLPAGGRAARLPGGADVVGSGGRRAAPSSRKIHEIDPTITGLRRPDDAGSDVGSMARQRFSTMMLGAFAVFALLLAIVGVYGVMSYLVAQGTHDIGVRMALGAQRSSICRDGAASGDGADRRWASSLGLIGAAALTRVMASLLFGISTTDVVTFSAVPLILVDDRAWSRVTCPRCARPGSIRCRAAGRVAAVVQQEVRDQETPSDCS